MPITQPAFHDVLLAEIVTVTEQALAEDARARRLASQEGAHHPLTKAIAHHAHLQARLAATGLQDPARSRLVADCDEAGRAVAGYVLVGMKGLNGHSRLFDQIGACEALRRLHRLVFAQHEVLTLARLLVKLDIPAADRARVLPVVLSVFTTYGPPDAGFFTTFPPPEGVGFPRPFPPRGDRGRRLA